jgi:hypothetical protein
MPRLSTREGGVGQIPDIQVIPKIVLAVPRKQVLGDVTAASDWAETRPGVRADRATASSPTTARRAMPPPRTPGSAASLCSTRR